MLPPSDQVIDILIPAFNEQDALPLLLDEIDRSIIRRIVVVDNASTDQTAEIAHQRGCQVVTCPTLGYGSACLAGLNYIRKDPPLVMVFLDGDRSDVPSFLPKLVYPILEGDQDFVLGSRTMGVAQAGSLNLVQRFGNRLATGLMRLFWGVAYSDLGPFRAIRWQSLEALAMQDTNFGWTIEMQIKAHLAGLRTLEVAVDYRNRIGTSKISGTLSGVFRAGFKILYTLFKYRFLRRGLRDPTQIS